MTRFELKLKIEMPTEMTDLPSIDVYKDGKLIEAHEGIYAEDLYNVIVGRCHLYDDIRMIKIDLSLNCNLNDEDMENDCFNCTRFIFPIGCMCGNDEEDKIMIVEKEE